VFLTTDDVDADYSRLSDAGVEFTSAPADMPYGRDCGLRDPSGNQLRLAQLSPQFAAA
jgi:predicted enzyme related to lactoylglutathione lyase